MSKSTRSSNKAAQKLGQKESAMSDETYDPSDYKAADVVEELDGASEEEKLKIAAAEQAGKNRKTVLEAAGVEENVRLDASGRQLHGWEVAPASAQEA